MPQDLAELASSRTIETSSSYASFSRAQPQQEQKQEYDPLLGLFGGAVPPAAEAGPQFDQALASLVQPSSSRVGLKLMRKMGWREGQGVGPRVSYEQRRRQAAEIGIRLEGDEAEEGDDEAARHFYAPLDRPLTLVKGSSASTDKGWGLGYRPGMGLKETLRAEGGYTGGSAPRTMTYDLEDDEVYDSPAMDVGGLSARDKQGLRTVDEDEDAGFSSMRSSRDPRTRQVCQMSRDPVGCSKLTQNACVQPRPRVSVPQDDFSDGTRLLPGFVLHRESVAPTNR